MFAMRSILIMSAASLLVACGSENLDGNTAARAALLTPLPQAAPCSDVATIAAGASHTVGLKEDGTAVAAGDDGFGQLNVSSWTDLKAIAAGSYHTVGLKEDGTVVAAGFSTYGQLNVLSWTDIKAIAAGMYHTVGLKVDGTAVAAGDNSFGQLNVSSWTDIKAIAAGAYHTVGLKGDGTVVATGHSYYGQLNVSSWTNIKALAAGTYHTVGLKEDGTVVGAGRNNLGQLSVSSWTNIKAIAAGANYTVGLKEDGTVVATGNYANGQLNVSSWTDITAIAAGANHTVGLKEDKTVVAVGNNDKGQLNISSLFTNIMPVCGPVVASPPDAASPTTTVVMTGTQGNNGWYVSDVQMTLAATDNEGGSGVMGIYYSVDGVEAIVEGSSASYAIVGDGTHTVTWFAIDNSGNKETPQEMSVNIDTTPPSISSLYTDPSILQPSDHSMTDVLIGGSVADDGSGIASTVISVTDEYGIYNMTAPGFGYMIQLESSHAGTDTDGRLYTITAVVTDHAGNQSSGATTVLVPYDRGGKQSGCGWKGHHDQQTVKKPWHKARHKAWPERRKHRESDHHGKHHASPDFDR
jgi:hypothetical protein